MAKHHYPTKASAVKAARSRGVSTTSVFKKADGSWGIRKTSSHNTGSKPKKKRIPKKGGRYS